MKCLLPLFLCLFSATVTSSVRLLPLNTNLTLSNLTSNQSSHIDLINFTLFQHIRLDKKLFYEPFAGIVANVARGVRVYISPSHCVSSFNVTSTSYSYNESNYLISIDPAAGRFYLRLRQVQSVESYYEELFDRVNNLTFLLNATCAARFQVHWNLEKNNAVISQSNGWYVSFGENSVRGVFTYHELVDANPFPGSRPTYTSRFAFFPNEKDWDELYSPQQYPAGDEVWPEGWLCATVGSHGTWTWGCDPSSPSQLKFNYSRWAEGEPRNISEGCLYVSGGKWYSTGNCSNIRMPPIIINEWKLPGAVMYGVVTLTMNVSRPNTAAYRTKSVTVPRMTPTSNITWNVNTSSSPFPTSSSALQRVGTINQVLTTSVAIVPVCATYQVMSSMQSSSCSDLHRTGGNNNDKSKSPLLEFLPTSMSSFGNSGLSEAVRATLWNVILVFFISIVHYLLVLAVFFFSSETKTKGQIMAMLMFPQLSLNASVFVVQGTSFYIMRHYTEPTRDDGMDATDLIPALAAAVIPIGSISIAAYIVYTTDLLQTKRYRPYPLGLVNHDVLWQRVMLPEAYWRNGKHRDRYGIFYAQMTPNGRWTIVYSLLVNFVTGALAGIQSQSGSSLCLGIAWVVIVMLVVLGLFYILRRPTRALMHSVTRCVGAFAAAVAVSAVMLIQHDATRVGLLEVCGYLLIVVVVVDVIVSVMSSYVDNIAYSCPTEEGAEVDEDDADNGEEVEMNKSFLHDHHNVNSVEKSFHFAFGSHILNDADESDQKGGSDRLL